MNKISVAMHLKYWAVICIALVCSAVPYAFGFDVPMHLWAQDFFASTRPFWKFLTDAGEGWVQVVFCYLVSFYYYRHADYIKSRFWFWAGPISLLAGVVGQLFKRSIGRPRPVLFDRYELYDMQWFEMGYKFHSFPSGHTLTTFAIVGVVASLYPRAKYLFILLAGLIGFTRIAVGAHWFADVLAGAVLGYVLGLYFSRLFLQKESK